jgi:integrase
MAIQKIHQECGGGWDRSNTCRCGLTEAQAKAASDLRWRLSFKDPNTGKLVRRRFHTGADAKAAEADLNVEVREGRYVTPTKVTLAELRAEVLEDHTYAEATVQGQGSAWAHVVAAKLGTKPITDITPADIARMVRPLKDRPEMATKVRLLVSGLYNHELAQPRPRVGSNPARKQQRGRTRTERKAAAKKEVRVLATEELDALRTTIDPRWRAMVELMAFAGLRPGEAVVLTVGKLDILERTLRVDTALAGDTKTGEPRTITLPAVVVEEILVPHLERVYGPGEWDADAPMFPKADGRAIETKHEYDAWRRRVFQKAAVSAGVNHGIRPNDLRHHAVAFAIGQGADVYAVSKMVGHAKPSITLDVYGFLWDQSAKGLAERMDAAIRATFGVEEAELDATDTVVVIR